MTAGIADPSRRALLLGGRRGGSLPRPPWTTEAALADSCTRCGACIAACPEGIVVRGGGGFPAVDFAAPALGGGCTFCRDCADACPEPVFAGAETAPWALVAAVGDGCLAAAGVHCQSCADACDARAIRFALRRGGPPLPRIDAAACTGCGACAPACPGDAITLAEAGDA